MRRKQQGLNFNRSHEKKKINFPLIRDILAWIVEIAIVLLLAFVLVYFLGMRIGVVGKSMQPTLLSTDEVLVDRFIYRLIDPKQDDLVVFLPNGNEKSHYYIKRVIGVPGDTVQIKNGELYVNDQLYRGEAEYESIADAGIAADPIVLGQEEFFVLGDNPDGSEDSRYANIGNIDRKYMIGKAWFLVSPRSRMELL